MKIETQPREDCQLTVHVEIEPERFAAALKRAARALSERVAIPGFRPGKAPYAMVAQQVGEDVIREEALDSLADEVYPTVLKELDLHPSYPGVLTNVEDGEPLRLTFVVPLPPQVSLGDYRSVRVPYEWVPPSAEAVDKFLKGIQIQHGTPRIVTEDRPIQVDDLAILKLALRRADAAPEAPPLLAKEPVVLIRENDQHPDELPFPGFSAQLIGLRKGEHKTIFYHYPDEDGISDLVRGQDVVHEVEIREIVVIDLPELTDEFAKTIGPFETIEALREGIAEFLQRHSRDQYESEYSLQVIDEIRQSAQVTYPPQMLEERVEELVEDFKADLEEDGQDLDTYLQSQEMTLEKLKEEMRPYVQLDLERDLVAEKVGEEERVKVNREDVEFILNQLVHEWVEKQQSSGKKRPKPSAKEIEAMLFFSINQARRKAIRDRLVAIGRGEAPESAEESETANTSAEGNASEAEAAAPPSAASTSNAP